jgi:hypothetical protein
MNGMKNIQKLKIWPLLEKEGFKIKEIRTGNICFGKGAILQPDFKTGFPFIEIQPLLNGRWRLSVEYKDGGSSWETTPGDIAKILPNELEIFKQVINQ